jgi:hypothetical protein
VRPNREQVPQNRPQWAKRAGNWRRIYCWFHHMNIRASTRDLAGVVQTILSNVATWLAPGGGVVAAVPNAQSLHRQLAVSMGLQPAIDHLSPRDHLVGHQRVYTLDELAADFEAAGLVVEQRFGYFVKIVPNSMMREWSPDLMRALTTISDKIPPHLLANIGVVARKAV